MDLELRLLRSFVTVADELHFGRAAERLHVTQPALSRQIQELERRVGARLLARNSRGVALTEAGRVLRDEGEGVLDQSARALDRAQRAGRGDLGHLSIGFVGSAIDTAVIPLLEAMRERHEGVVFTLAERAWREQTAGLWSGEDDAAFVRDLPADCPWQVIDLQSEPLRLVVPTSHPLARHRRVTRNELRGLADTPFMTTRRWIEHWGVQPRAMDEVASTPATLRLVEAGLGISLMPAGYQRQAGPNVHFIPINGETSLLQLALPHRPRPPAADRFLALVHERFPRAPAPLAA
jgi:DNA-binding transcriptional LysR family regulator